MRSQTVPVVVRAFYPEPEGGLDEYRWRLASGLCLFRTRVAAEHARGKVQAILEEAEAMDERDSVNCLERPKGG